MWFEGMEYINNSDSNQRYMLCNYEKLRSVICIGSGVKVFVDKHFNKLQKLMIQWCFGFKVTDLKEEQDWILLKK